MKKIIAFLLGLILLVGCSNQNNDKDYVSKANSLIVDFLDVKSKFSDTYYHIQTKGYDDEYNTLIEDTKTKYNALNDKIKNLGDTSDELKSLSEKMENTNKSIYKLINMIQNEHTKIIEVDTEKEQFDKLLKDLTNDTHYYYDKLN